MLHAFSLYSETGIQWSLMSVSYSPILFDYIEGKQKQYTIRNCLFFRKLLYVTSNLDVYS